MAACDLVVVTGSQSNVRAAYRSGTPPIGVGAGNVPVIVDSSADLDAAAAKIAASKCFDNATSCSSENAAIVLDGGLRRCGGRAAARRRPPRGRGGQGGDSAHPLGGRGAQPQGHREGFRGPRRRMRARRQGARRQILHGRGDGRSAPNIPSPTRSSPSCSRSIVRRPSTTPWARSARSWRSRAAATRSASTPGTWHTRDGLAEELDTARVLVNMAHTFGNGGGFDSGLNFTLSMGCGTWQGNSISENLNYRHFLNITQLAVPIPRGQTPARMRCSAPTGRSTGSRRSRPRHAEPDVVNFEEHAAKTLLQAAGIPIPARARGSERRRRRGRRV